MDRLGARIPLVIVGSLLVVLLGTLYVNGCGSMAPPGLVTPPTDGATDSPLAAGRLTLKLATSLDAGVGGTAKATAITKAELLSKTGAVVKTATISAGAASFALAGLATGDYFIRVNNLGTVLVPTRIDSTTAAMSQFVGRKLRRSVIGSLASPTYAIVTFPSGQRGHAVARYTNGAVAPPTRYAYAIARVKGAKSLTTRVLGTAALLTSSRVAGQHTFATWMVGPNNHGSGSTASCAGCHGSLSAHPARYSSAGVGNGWCYKCHYGKAGPSAGLVDPKQ